MRGVICDAGAFVAGVEFSTAEPRAMHAERAFWEKAPAIQVFCLRNGSGRALFPALA